MNEQPERDIFNTKWVIIGVVVVSLVMPIVSSCGVKGDLKHPKNYEATNPKTVQPAPPESAQSIQPEPVK